MDSVNSQVIGIDAGKNWFHVVVMDSRGQQTDRRKLRRDALLEYIAQHERCLIAMESCAGTQFLATKMQALGHEVRLVPAQFAAPFRKSNKNDFNDAEAVAEAAMRGHMRFSRVKSIEELDLQALHRARDRLIRERTGQINQIRAFLLENGITVAQGRAKLQHRLPELMRDANSGLSGVMLHLLDILVGRWRELDNAISKLTHEIELIARASELCQRLVSIPGIGTLSATALVAAVGDARQFRHARDLAAWIGLVPRQFSTGGKPRLLGVGRRGNGYVRKLLIHGARGVMSRLNRSKHRLAAWLTSLERRVHPNIAAVALANKLARIAWAVLTKGEIYRPT
ncbi:IS110 family transposase [Paraburkholderia sp. GAS42]|uniref:IS110 family transposase n=1 Tax=Paraburkholderia sp. GAS42 TaxID=3035135 RepID=UPI003D2076B4